MYFDNSSRPISSSRSLFALQPAKSHSGSDACAYSQSSSTNDGPQSSRLRVCKSLWHTLGSTPGSAASAASRSCAAARRATPAAALTGLAAELMGLPAELMGLPAE